MVLQETHALLSEQKDIWTLSQISDQIRRKSNVSIANHFVGKVLRDQVGLKYRRVKTTAFAGNNNRSLALRCLYAKAMLK
jgi:transposase